MKHIIDGMEVETSDYLTASVGDYTVRDGKIWRVNGRFGFNVGDGKSLEREIAGEKAFVKNPEKIFKAIRPTGHIRI